MTVLINIPRDAETALREAFGDTLDRAALEALVAEGYRAGKFNLYRVQQLLGFGNRWDTEGWLGDHNLHLNYSVEDLEVDAKTLDHALGSIQK